jgi:hypothetical protein
MSHGETIIWPSPIPRLFSISMIGALRVVECPPNKLDDQVNVPVRRKVLCGIVERKRRDASAHAICSPHTLVGKGFDETRYWKKINHRSEEGQHQPSKHHPPVWQSRVPTFHLTPRTHRSLFVTKMAAWWQRGRKRSVPGQSKSGPPVLVPAPGADT